MLKATIYFVLVLAYAALDIVFIEHLKTIPLVSLSNLAYQAIVAISSIPLIILFDLSRQAFDKRKGVSQSKPQIERKHPLERILAGDIPMWSAFWGFHIPLIIIFSVFLSYVFFRYAIKHNNQIASFHIIPFIIVVFSLTLGIVGTWRSSKRYAGSELWIVLTRIGLILSSICAVISLMLAVVGISLFFDK